MQTDLGMVKRLARACARGWRQESLVTELLCGPTPIRETHFGVEVGLSKVGWASFVNLRERLVEFGFVFEMDRGRAHEVRMTFPERTT